MENLFELWSKAQQLRQNKINFETLNFMGDISSLHAAVTMLQHDVGFSIVPLHVVTNEIKTGRLDIVSSTVKFKHTSEIYIATLKNYTPTARAEVIINTFRKMLKTNP